MIQNKLSVVKLFVITLIGLGLHLHARLRWRGLQLGSAEPMPAGEGSVRKLRGGRRWAVFSLSFMLCSMTSAPAQS